jgi:hypothetical protein
MKTPPRISQIMNHIEETCWLGEGFVKRGPRVLSPREMRLKVGLSAHMLRRGLQWSLCAAQNWKDQGELEAWEQWRSLALRIEGALALAHRQSGESP